MRRDTGILIFPFSGDFLNSWKIYLESRGSPSRGFDVDRTSALLNAEKSWHEVVERSLWRDLEHWLKAIPTAEAERFLTTDRTDQRGVAVILVDPRESAKSVAKNC